MQITNIYPTAQVLKYNNQTKLNTQTNPQETKQPEQTQKLPLPSTKQYLSFTGGYSLDLGETIKNLDKLAQKYPDIYPKNVREWAGMILEEGNKQKDTLITIHKKLYENIKDCFSLKELKERFPEFKDVKSANDIEYKEGSLIDEIKQGKLEYFNPEEDLSLQLIKLYWGEGFSLNDLKNYTNGKDINHVMEKLNIPKVNRNYGHILKFSDPEYNERLTKQMTQKRLETLDLKAQQAEGEPVHIKRGPLSLEHRKHISEGLIKFYKEHPERAFEMSERQKQFYKDNPDQAELFHRVMKKAWGLDSATKIKVALSKFMTKHGLKEITIDELENPMTLSKEKSDAMRKFWAINEWAKKTLSKNVEYGWRKVKEEQDMFYIVDVTPKLFKRRFFIWAKNQGIDTSNITFEDLKYYPHKPELNIHQESSASQYTPEFIDSIPGDESQKIANAYQMTLLKFGQELKKVARTNISQETRELTRDIRYYLRNTLFDFSQLYGCDPKINSFDASEIQQIYVRTATTLMDMHENKLLKLLNDLLNKSYETLDRHWKPNQPLLLDSNAFDF